MIGIRKRLRDLLRPVVVPALALITAFLLGAIVIVLTDYEHLQHFGTDPVGAVGGAIDGMVEGYRAMLAGAIGDPGRIVAAIRSREADDIAAAIRPFSETLVSATPFIFVTLGLMVSFRAGLFNLGADGQFLMGGVGASITALLVAGQLPPFLALVASVIGGTVAGAAYGFVPGFLKARTGAHEVITTLMLNAIAPNLPFLIFGAISFSGPPGPIPSVPLVIDLPTIRVDYGFFVALAMAAVVSLLLFRTTRGFEIRATGLSPTVARGTGMAPGRTTMLAMSLSGGLVGMGSAFFGLGPGGGFSGGPVRDMGYVAIALALLAGLRPSGVVLAALFYGALTTGAKSMVIATGIPLALLVVIVTIAMMFVAAPGLVRSIWRVRADRPALGSAARPSTKPTQDDVPTPDDPRGRRP
jgi:general nucleoside transport system permease protein